jgi:aminoglycoside phosphotransferase (APT) family kinase protein
VAIAQRHRFPGSREEPRALFREDPPVRVDRVRWGFATPTRVLTLRSGRRVVLQRPTGVDVAARTLLVGARLGAAGIPVPRVVGALLDRPRPLLVFEHVAGVPGPEILGDGPALATAMGRLLPAIADVADPAIPIESDWASPRALEAAVVKWLAHSGGADEGIGLAARVGGIVARVAREPWTPVVSHGDYVPANALISGDRVSALVDLGQVGRRHPWLDAAWWCFVVAYHHPIQARRSSPQLLDAAGLSADSERISALADLAALRALELHATCPSPHARRLLLAAVDRAGSP